MSNKRYIARTMRLLATALFFTVACVALVFVAPVRAASDESDVRSAIESAFKQLRAGILWLNLGLGAGRPGKPADRRRALPPEPS